MTFDADKLAKDRSELRSTLDVIMVRMDNQEFADNMLDPVLWDIIASQLRRSAAIAQGLFRNCSNLQP